MADRLIPGNRIAFAFFLAPVCIAFLVSSAQQTAEAKIQKRKLQRMEPIFDTSLVPKPTIFELNVKHTQIIYPEDPGKVLHGDSKIVDLSGEVKRDVLQGQALEEQLDSSVDTVEHEVKATFFVDLRKMAAKYAPDIEWMMESEIQAARLRSASEAARQEKLMQRELKARTPVPDIPSNTEPKKANIKDLASEIAKAAARDKTDSNDSSKQLAQALEQARSAKTPDMPNLIASASQIKTPLQVPASGPLAFPQGSGSLRGFPIPIPSNNSSVEIPELTGKRIPSIQDPQKAVPLKLPGNNPPTKILGPQLSDELVKAKLITPDSKALIAEMKKAQRNAKAMAKEAQTAMDMVLTSLRKIPELRLPANQATTAEAEDSLSTVKWDKWHAHFAELAREPILKCINEAGNPSGADTIEITVYNNHKLKASISKAGVSEFDQAMLRAYSLLDGNAGLQFPDGSRRKSITMQIDNKHTGKGAAKAVKSITTIGDKETIRLRH